MKENLGIWSMDAEALYPSLAIKDILDGIWHLVMDSDLEFKNLNIEEMFKFLAVMYPREELVRRQVVSCIPSKTVDEDGTARREPTLAYLDKDTYTRTRNGVKEKDVNIHTGYKTANTVPL